MACAAILGNLLVISQRYRRAGESSSQNVQRVLILHLAAADLIMGVYLVMIGVADAQYGNEYSWYTTTWRQTSMCKVAGFLAMLSSEASLFILATISIDRFLILVFPFSRARLRGKPLPITIAGIWLVSVLLAAVCIPLTNDDDSEVFGQSSVCIALPLITRQVSTDGFYKFTRTEKHQFAPGNFNFDNSEKAPAWVSSIVVFLGINSLCLIVVMACYICIYFSVMFSRKSVSRDANVNEEIRMAVKMAVIVGTDFCCWLPVIIMGILTQSHLIGLPWEVYAWVIVFVLPINSSINPYLYTLNGSLEHIQKYRSRRRRSSTGRSTVTQRLTRVMSRESKEGSLNMSKYDRKGLPPALTSPIQNNANNSPSSMRKVANNDVNYAPINDN